MDIVETIAQFNDGRDPERLRIKYANLRKSAFVFLRGTCHLFHARLARIGWDTAAPRVWACGDLHLENFGSFKGDNRLVYFDLNDFDEAARAPASADLTRLLTSLLVAAETIGLAPSQASSIADDVVGAYRSALVAGKARWIERDTARGLIHHLLDTLRDQRRADLLARRTVIVGKRRRLLCDGKKALPASTAEQARATRLLHACELVKADPDFFEPVDIARRIAGTGSLGLERYAVLVRGKGGPNGHALLDIKQAAPSTLAANLNLPQPEWASEAHRVVAIQNAMQAASPAFLQVIARRRNAYVLRALQPSEDRVALQASQQGFAPIRGALLDMGRLLAWAQLRSAGRYGADNADALIAYAEQVKQWRKPLLNTAHRLARQTIDDWHAYADAYDRGAFDPAGAGRALQPSA